MSEYYVAENLQDHYFDALKHFDDKNIVGLWLQGSQNYGLATENSDVDTKLLVTPTLHDLASNKKPVSTTFIRENNEHIDFKDVREYIQLFRKQNLNFVEILFTEYYILNTPYAFQWEKLIANRERIARMNPLRCIHSMAGIAAQKYHAMEKPFESKKEILAVYGYDPKQLHHLVRITDFMARYIQGELYEKCMTPNDIEWHLRIKKGYYNLEEARDLANRSMRNIDGMKEYCNRIMVDKEDAEMVELLQNVQYEIMKTSLMMEVNK